MRLIDADALIDKLDIMISEAILCDTQIHYALIREQVAEQPTINAETVRHGEWCGEWERGRYMCSVCKTMTDVAEIMGKPAYKFCPNCGAVMSGGAENAVSGE